MRRDVIGMERVGTEEIRLVQADEGFRVIIASPHGENVYEKSLFVRWTCRTQEMAQKAFDWVVTMERLWEAMATGKPTDSLFRRAEKLTAEVNETGRRLKDFPPGTAGAAEFNPGNDDR